MVVPAGNIGKRHPIIYLQLSMKEETNKSGVAKLTSWSAFREDITQFWHIQTFLIEWTQALKQWVKKYTQEIALTEDTPAADRHLNLWEARKSFTKRCKHQKPNKTRKKCMALLNRQAQENAATLHSPKWHSFCDKFKGTLSTKKASHLLQRLLDSSNSRTQANREIEQLINSDLHPRELRYIRNNILYYTGRPNQVSMPPSPSKNCNRFSLIPLITPHPARTESLTASFEVWIMKH